VVDSAPVPLVTRAALFAAEKHAAQRRKDAQRTPYINHLIEVAHLLAAAGGDASLVAAGFLHDVIEDQGETVQGLRDRFGDDVARLVQFATDDKSQAKHERKNGQVTHAASADLRQANLKLADKISNLRSLRDAPPSEWTGDRIEKYIAWAHAVVSALPDAAPGLRAEYDAIRRDLLRARPAAEFADPHYDAVFFAKAEA
jgi:(p)ppGpp synthase/HD superfamily hydrolase